MKRAVLLLALGAPAMAQQVYRCGSEYSATPCPQGQAVEVSDPRTPAQHQQARAAARQDATMAADLERERQQREAAARGQSAGGFYTLPRAAASPQPSASAPKGKGKKKKQKTPTRSQPRLAAG